MISEDYLSRRFNQWSRREDLNLWVYLNLRPLRPERSTLPDCATPRLSAQSNTAALKMAMEESVVCSA